MNYRTRSKRIDTGHYQLTYGRGADKLSCTIWHNDVAGRWCISEGDGKDALPNGHPKKKQLVQAWGEWAERVYGTDVAESPRPDAGQPSVPQPASPARKGPPRHKPSLKEKGPPKRSKSGPPKHKAKTPPNLDLQREADPFDERFQYPADHKAPVLRRQLTPLGVLVEIAGWAEKNAQRLRDVEALQPVLTSVRDCIQREAPDLFKRKEDHADTTTDTEQAAAESDAGDGDDDPTLPFDD